MLVPFPAKFTSTTWSGEVSLGLIVSVWDSLEAGMVAELFDHLHTYSKSTFQPGSISSKLPLLVLLFNCIAGYEYVQLYSPANFSVGRLIT